jgi:hypothetical protein
MAGFDINAKFFAQLSGGRSAVYAHKLVGVLALGSSKIETGGFSPPG